jgi:hypothetical protein
MTPRMRELYERCCANDGGVTATFLKQTDKWLLAHLKRQGWVVTWPDRDVVTDVLTGHVRVSVVRLWPGMRRRTKLPQTPIRGRS